MLCVAILNEVDPSHSPLAAQITAGWLTRAAAAFQLQLREHVAPYYSYAAGAVVRVCSEPSDLGDAEDPLRIIASDPSAPGAEAYHSFDGGHPDEFLMTDTVNTLDDVSGAAAHENAETSGDATCDKYVTVPSGITLPTGLVAGMQIALEVSDPLQDRLYPIDLGDSQPPIMVADFVLPPYFDVSLSGPTSYGETRGGPRLAPFDRTSGGYQIARQGDGSGETQIFGCVPGHKLSRARHPHSRWYRRGIRVSGSPLGLGAIVL